MDYLRSFEFLISGITKMC